ncbi:alpha/beta fold hydrolase [Tahibacter amnicola]|uniref:Alpha/beta hydrolase n=1 Tax=Tahibacter amnicola TaxID=2976241 RepID=A0ABY6B844_9GAMM|nr:alpha/beta hydrolase [Tahibacter amnicola]UXI65844.1 alpha/beta hydrolase [Tahibacter amnicola]
MDASRAAVPALSLDAWRAAGDTHFHYRGHAIFSCRGGAPDAPPLLLIHGFPTASWDWEALWPALCSRYRVLALDMIGFGFSDKPRDYDYSLFDQADLCEAYLLAQGIERYHLLAHDYGDTVAQELLARQADPDGRPRLMTAALLNGGLFPETHRPVIVQRLLLSPLGPWVARAMTQARFSAALHRIFGPGTPPHPALVAGFWRLLQHNDGVHVMHKLIRYMVERRRHRTRWVGALQQSSVPIALVAGMADPVSGAHMVARYRSLVPRPDITELVQIGHYPQCEAPDAVLEAYLAFRERSAGSGEPAHVAAGSS